MAARRAAEELIELDERGSTACIVNRDIPDGLDREYCDLAYMVAHFARKLAGESTPIKSIETSFYGQLKAFSNWLVVPVISGVCENFDRLNTHSAAEKFLKESGIGYTNREPDDGKHYKNSITVDLLVEQKDNTFRRISVRGTVTESHLMIARIDEFDGLYFEPKGPIFSCIYADRPGMIAAISRRIADKGINIEDIRNPHDQNTGRSLVILKLSKSVDPDTLSLIARDVEATSALSITL